MTRDITRAKLPTIPVVKTLLQRDESPVAVPCAVTTAHTPWLEECDLFSGYFRKIHGITPVREPGGLELIMDPSVPANAYVLDSAEGIRLFASDEEGLRYGLASVLQLATVEKGLVTFPNIRVEDHPDKDYRGLMVDLARCWHPLDKVLKFIDICFFYKVKYLHLHFVDNQSWTLPSKAFPELPTKGRNYSFADIETIVRYAKERGIVLVPEVETPGHSTALIAAYPEVFGNSFTPADKSKIVIKGSTIVDSEDHPELKGNIICAGKPEAMEGVKTLMTELMEMFPHSPFIHIGGDEAAIANWNRCEHCRTYMQENNIPNEKVLYCDFVARVAQFILDNGRTPIVWEGFPKEGAPMIPKETIVIAWESLYNYADDLLEEGFRIINCAWKPLYVVPYPNCRWTSLDLMAWNIYTWQHCWDASRAYYNPITVPPTDAMLGAQLCAWECCYEQEISIILENLAAVSERTWSVERIRSDLEFNDAVWKIGRKLARVLTD